jgi:hypothetical protein
MRTITSYDTFITALAFKLRAVWKIEEREGKTSKRALRERNKLHSRVRELSAKMNPPYQTLDAWGTVVHRAHRTDARDWVK